MKKEFEKLFEPVQFKSGIKINSRFVMSPMVVEGSTYEGYVGEEDLSYFERRANVSDLLISGATSIAKDANAFGYGLTNADESYLEGMKKLVATMKKMAPKQ
ncbi:2,4-dienoyl-CoA reductase-like NADH-dependent reductase (Old Yellow Enzyme family) [Melissococcus plutonius]|nr:2,4-dienoyl-CoA reductase-like NADH-dependent reductase (Old Yellow Enzyme family) [Melissococcus plutonius]